MRVKFLRDEQFENEGRNQGPKFVKGGTYDFTDAFANRWLQRKVAELVDADIKVDADNLEPISIDPPDEGEAPAVERPEPLDPADMKKGPDAPRHVAPPKRAAAGEKAKAKGK